MMLIIMLSLFIFVTKVEQRLLVLPNTAGKKELHGFNTCCHYLPYSYTLGNFTALTVSNRVSRPPKRNKCTLELNSVRPCSGTGTVNNRGLTVSVSQSVLLLFPTQNIKTTRISLKNEEYNKKMPADQKRQNYQYQI